MTDINHAPVCGIYCGGCEFLGEQCKGCGTVKGKPFWTAELPTGICPFYDCCINEKQLEHCGLCGELPCKLFLEIRDPNLSDEEFHASIGLRQKALNPIYSQINAPPEKTPRKNIRGKRDKRAGIPR